MQSIFLFKKFRVFILVVLFLFITISNIIWLNTDNTPQRWDESIHLNSASSFADILKTNPFKIIKTFITQESFYPPLIPLIGAFFGVFYPEQDNFTYSMILFNIILILFTFLFAEKLFDSYSALCAAFMIVSFPLIFVEGHYFMFDLPLTSFIIAATYFLFNTKNFSDKKNTLLFFIISGLGFLIKWSFLIYIITPFIIYIHQNKKEFFSHSQKQNLLLGLLIFFLIFSPWYIYNSFPILKNLIFYSFKRGAEERLPHIFSIDSLLYYLKILPDKITVVFFILFLISFFLILPDKKNRYFLLFIIIPFLFFTFLGNKKDRYIMPIMPFIAILISYIIFIIKNANHKKLIALVIISFAFFNYTFANYNLPFKWLYNCRPNRANWHIKDFLNEIKEEATLSIVPDHPFMNNALYSFYAKNFYKNVKIIGIFNFPSFTDYFLLKTGDLGPFFSGLEKRKKILENVTDSSSELLKIYEKIKEITLPDGSSAMLYKLKNDININEKIFSNNLNKNINLILNNYLKNPDGFIYEMKLNKKQKHIIDNIKIKFKKGFIGDFKHKDTGLLINDAELEINNIFLNPYALEKEKLEIIKIERIKILSLNIKSKDLQDFISCYAKDINNIRVKFSDGIVNLSGNYKNLPLFISFTLFNPNPGKDNSDVFFKIIKIKISFIPLPAYILNFILKDYNPLLVKSNSFIKVNFGKIVVSDENLNIF